MIAPRTRTVVCLLAAIGPLGALGPGLTRAAAHNPVATTVTWTREIAPLLERRCVTCHRTGGFSSVPLTTYEEVRPWAVAIKEVALAGEMPPWGAAAGVGHFANDPRLTRHELEVIGAWVDGGAPYSRDARTPAFLDAAAGTPVRTARAAPSMPPGAVTLPLAPATVETSRERVASVTLQLPGPMTLIAWSFEPGLAASVEQVDLEAASRWVGTWTPGDRPIRFAADAGAPLADTALFTARIRYRARAERAVDYSRLLLWLSKEAHPKSVREVTVVQAWRAPAAVDLLAVRPARGDGAAQITARYPNGRVDAIGDLTPPRHGAHPTYRLARGLPLPAGASIATTAPVRVLYAIDATRTVNRNVSRRPRR